MNRIIPLLGIPICAAIGAVAGLLTSDMRPDGAAAGAVIGAIIGSWLSIRVRAHRAAIGHARQNPQEAVNQENLKEKHYQTKRWAERDSVTSYKIEEMAARRNDGQS